MNLKYQKSKNRFENKSRCYWFQYKQCVTLWNYALRLKSDKETLLSSDSCFTARAIVQLFLNIMTRWKSKVEGWWYCFLFLFLSMLLLLLLLMLLLLLLLLVLMILLSLQFQWWWALDKAEVNYFFLWHLHFLWKGFVNEINVNILLLNFRAVFLLK